MASFSVRGRGVRTRGGRGRGRGSSSTPSRLDNNMFAVLSEPGDFEQDGDDFDIHDNSYLDMTVGFDGAENDWNLVRSKQTKRQRISSSGQSGHDTESQSQMEPMEHDTGEHYDSMSTEGKLSLIISKLSLNEQRVKYIQHRVDSMVLVKKRVIEIENVVKSHSERLKLLEYRSLDSEARSRRRNLLFKGIPENKYENCFTEARRFIHEKLNIETDMYLERAHRLGRFDPSKTRPIIVAFRDFCDTEYILNGASCLRGTDQGVSRDYPNEISKARQSIWKQYKSIRENNPRKRVTFGYPASIRVNGDTVVDLFPDWYDVLKGNRITLPQIQSNYSAMSGDQQTLRRETGSTGIYPVPGVLINNALSREQTASGAPTTSKPSSMNEPGLFSRDHVESDSEIGDPEPMSQSLLPQGKPDAENVNSATHGIGPSAENETFVKPRGRSLTRRANANSASASASDRKRSQTSMSRAPKSKSTVRTSATNAGSNDSRPPCSTRAKTLNSRSVSRMKGSKDPPDSNQNKQCDDNQRPDGSSDKNTNV